MVLNICSFVIGFVFFAGSSKGYAGGLSAAEIDYYTINSFEVREINQSSLDQSESIIPYKLFGAIDGYRFIEAANESGKIIGMIKDLVALGEDVYRLVIKGKPTVTTSYTPISVMPRINGEVVDIFDTENWRMPLKRSFEARYKNVYGINVVVFRYAVIFSYGGTYDGKGAYLTAVQVVPELVTTAFGYDFTSTMKLGGVQNNGSRANPVAAATILMEYTVSTLVKTETNTGTYFMTGNGEFRKY